MIVAAHQPAAFAAEAAGDLGEFLPGRFDCGRVMQFKAGEIRAHPIDIQGPGIPKGALV